ncbi:extracellular solute-binding protein, partial [Aerococcus urinae]
TNNYTEYARGGKIVNIDEEFPASERDGWLQGAIDQYTVDGHLYGVPVLTDPSIAVYYNKSLLDAAGVSVEDLQNLSWDPNASTDSL